MNTNRSALAKFAQASVLGLGLLGGAALAPAGAQTTQHDLNRLHHDESSIGRDRRLQPHNGRAIQNVERSIRGDQAQLKRDFKNHRHHRPHHHRRPGTR